MNKENLKKTAHPLRLWRVGVGLTQEELAHKLGYASPSVIQGIEAWKFEPKIGEVLTLCKMSEGSPQALTPWDFADPLADWRAENDNTSN